MAPSLAKAIGSAVAVLPALASASSKVYKVSEVYDSSNFFDKFDFVTVSGKKDNFTYLIGTGSHDLI